MKAQSGLLFVALLAVFNLAQAASLIELMDGEGGAQKIWIEGQKVRIEDSREPGYLLIDGKERKMFAINPEEKQIIDMTDMFLQEGEAGLADRFKVEYKHKGKGKTVAGYATEHYELIVDGKKCGDEYVSLQALKDLNALEILDTMAQLNAADIMNVPANLLDPCDFSDALVMEEYKTKGYPMLILDDKGQMLNEVKSINKSAPLPEGGFSLPKGYVTLTYEQLMEMFERQQEESQMHPVPEGMDPEEYKKLLQEMLKQPE